ncbi:flagellar assembly protein FlgT [Alteromonas sp. D210916BOD_24]|uniref:flagellar assembly protein T N-terminal domain-containing protein n=1 Tax=Alteromonas sp. D210916BOD_24 TaxID=3157618 RepID=UPI00399C795C
MQQVSPISFNKTRSITVALLCLFYFIVGQANAVWYEAKGQAVVINDDKEGARKKATQEALKQAMLFAGASIHSVQRLTNGLLENEEMTIRTTGEVEQLEIVGEVFRGDVVTVTVRADIFPRSKACTAQADEKHFATTHFLVRNRQHLTLGNLSRFDEALTDRFANAMKETTEHLKVTYIAPHTTNFHRRATVENVRTLSANGNTQFVLIGAIDDLSARSAKSSIFTPWRNNETTRVFAMTINVYDGINGGLLYSKAYSTNAQWTFDRFETVDEFSSQFWQSTYGKAVDTVMAEAIQDIQAATACQPVTGRVIQVAGDTVSISLGRDNGIVENDELFLYQAKEVIDGRGQKYLQYTLYPGTFVVENTFGNSSTVVNKSTGLITNIQENDFVVKK